MDDTPPVPTALNYEETPIIDPTSGVVAEREEVDPTSVIPEAAQIFESSSSPDRPRQTEKPHKNHLGTIIFVILLFGLGMWLSMQLRTFFSPATTQEAPVPTSVPLPLVTTAPPSQATMSAIPDSSWVTYQVISGVSYKLPPGVAAPVCDGGSCPSRGTNLPGGTRFTVAARGKGQLLPDFRGAILTDTTGKEFTMKQTTIGGVYVYEYVGNFTGRTGGGYTFTAMRGVLVPVNDTLAIEFNHFAPMGTTSDFAKDDTLFDAIVGTFITTFPTSIPVATSSGN